MTEDSKRGSAAGMNLPGMSDIPRASTLATDFVPAYGTPDSAGSSNRLSRVRKGFVATRRGSTGAIPSPSFSNSELFSTPENKAFDDFSERESLPRHGRRQQRRSSLSKIETEVMLRHSLASVHEYQDRNENIQRLKERFERRGSALTRSSQRSSMIGSVVEANLSDDFYSCAQADTISDTTQASAERIAHESESIPFTELHQDIDVQRNGTGKEREHLIECLVNFSSHIATSVLQDLVSHESKTKSGTRSEFDSDSSLNSDGSLSSLSSGEDQKISVPKAEEVVQYPSATHETLLKNRSTLPPSRERESALLFVDITGFTKLSTVLDVESLSKVINSYFEMIVTEVILHGGDVLKFAGDAFFAEWRASEEPHGGKGKLNPMQRFNSSLSSSQGFHKSGNDRDDISRRAIAKPISSRVWQAARCAASIVDKFSDFHVSVDSRLSGNSLIKGQALLDVHCGIGAGRVVGLHVSDFQEDTEDAHEEAAGVELRREFLVIGDAIDQVSRAAHLASNGEVVASPEALVVLSNCCHIPEDMLNSLQPVHIASKSQTFFSLEPFDRELLKLSPNRHAPDVSIYENIRKHCQHLDHAALSRLHLQMALYVHPVIRGDELERSKTISYVSEVSEPESRHLAQAELRSVYTMFINALVPPVLIGDPKIDGILFKTLRNIMHVTSRELDRYSGQLRQFIVDDKGVVLIATFGLRGSTFTNLVVNNGLPATFSIHKALYEELGVENKIGATFGQVYCGVVGGVTRHEFSVLGAAVNLAARLMQSSMNNGILVDGEVGAQADATYAFRSLQPIKTKGYDKPVPTLEPLHAIQQGRRRGSSVIAFTGRQEEKNEIIGFAKEILVDPVSAPSSVIGLIGESGIGKILLGGIRELCEFDGSIKVCDDYEAVNHRYHSGDENDSGTDTESVDSQSLRNSSHREEMPPSPSFLSPRSQKSIMMNQRASIRRAKTEATVRPRRLRRRADISSRRWRKGNRQIDERRDSLESNVDVQLVDIPYLDKLSWACEETGFSTQYADLVGSRFLGIESARPVTHVMGKVPPISELVDFVAQAFMKITGFADLVVVFIDDFQWVDSFTWKVIRALGQSGKKMVLICAMRSHDKQAMRRISTAVNFRLEITLGPLDVPDIKQLAVSVLRCNESTIDDLICTEIYEMTGGLPVFVIELLEDIKRNRTATLNNEGKLRLSESPRIRKGKGNHALGEALLNRFDSLDARVRSILQTCAVLGNSFAFSDLVRVHRETDEAEIEESLNTATSEMILVEITEEYEEDGRSVFSNSTGGSSSRKPPSIDYSGTTTTGFHTIGDRYFEFSHDMWRSNVLKTMLKERKIELHRQIAQAMELDRGMMIRRNDIARLLTLYDHWKSCNSFVKAAPLALAVGTRLNEWDLQAQSTDLYQDTLEICYESVALVDQQYRVLNDDWVEVSSEPGVLDFILLLHIRIAENLKSMGDLDRAAGLFRDAHKILKSSANGSSINEIPILEGLCTVQLELDPGNIETLSVLMEDFVTAARSKDNPIHLLRALSLEAAFFAQQGEIQRALHGQQELSKVYKIEQHSEKMVRLYGKDYALECLSQGILWYSLAGDLENASLQSDVILRQHLPYLDPKDIDSIMALILPAILTLKTTGRALEADYIMKKHVINAYHQLEHCTSYWVEMFNPICYLLEIVKMEDSEQFDEKLVDALEDWVLQIANNYYTDTNLRLGHTIMGEICYRLGRRKMQGDPLKILLFAKSKLFLRPIARDTQSEPFLAHSAFQLLRAL
eukprot:scaffold8301_cov184-Cylindrotheca_fusiformis.AAC.4